MGDIGDMWREMKPILAEESRARKATNLSQGELLIARAGHTYEWKSSTHMVIIVANNKWDYWPSTGKWSRRIKGSKQTYSRGVKSLLKDLTNPPQPTNDDDNKGNLLR